MGNEGNTTLGTNGILKEIQHLKEEAEKYSWLLGEDLKDKIIRVLEEKENRILERLIMWLA